MCVSLPLAAQDTLPDAARGKTYDELLDLNVRDGLVYYRVLRAERGRLDAFVASLANVSIESAPRDAQIAFWLNAYNALVLKTVVDHYPIPQRTSEYPKGSIRQIRGVRAHRAPRRGLGWSRWIRSNRRFCRSSTIRACTCCSAAARSAAGGSAAQHTRSGPRDASERGGRGVRHPRAVYRDRPCEQSDQHQPDLLLALTEFISRLHECRAGEFATAARSSARSSRFIQPHILTPSGSSRDRTSSRSSSSPSTGRSTI